MSGDDFEPGVLAAVQHVEKAIAALTRLADVAPSPALRERTLECAHAYAVASRSLTAWTLEPAAVDAAATVPVDVGGLHVDPVTRRVSVDGRDIELTRIEMSLLLVLARRPDVAVSTVDLTRAVWGASSERIVTRTVASHVCRLRRKLGPGFVGNVWGYGYRLLETAA